MSGIFPIHRHVDYRSHLMALFIGYPQMSHKFFISRRNPYAVHQCRHAVSADFLNLFYPVFLNFPAISILKAFADGMGGITLRQSRIFQKFFI